jgi:putative nucleotidyltransferase with HDIG domain
MSGNRGLQSMFQQNLDRALFASYFVGAVVPMALLAWLVHEFALPELTQQGFKTATVIGVLCGSGVLVLAGYFATRRIAGRALARMDADNAGLAQLLATARTLSRSAHAEEVAEAAASGALALVGADAVFVLGGHEKDASELSTLSSAGPRATELADELETELVDLAMTALSDGSPAKLRFDRASETGNANHGTIAAIPIRSYSTSCVIVVVRADPEASMLGDREIDVLDTLAGISAVALDNADLQYTQRNFFAHVTDMLVMALDAHVDRRSGHATKVAELANRVAREMGLEEAMVRRIHMSALLHDIGMLKVAPEHQQTPAYFQKHPGIGARMLSRIRLWREAAPIVMHHHEHFDGSGYPNGLVGEDIPLESRVILVVDAFDAMTREEAHRPALPMGHALDELRNGMATQFDPGVVRAFLELVQRGEISD